LDAAGVAHELYSRFGPAVKAYCLGRLRTPEEADDAVQTTFLNVFRALQRGTVPRAEQAWLFAIAQNVCGARAASSGRRLRLEAPNDFQLLQETVPAPASSSSDELFGLEDALALMPENQRRAFLLREWKGLSYHEIASELGVTQTSVEMLIFRARRSLAKNLGQPVALPARKQAGGLL
jgi:RNA polymerase sigma-70 factor (ECF subfamily)